MPIHVRIVSGHDHKSESGILQVDRHERLWTLKKVQKTDRKDGLFLVNSLNQGFSEGERGAEST